MSGTCEARPASVVQRVTRPFDRGLTWIIDALALLAGLAVVFLLLSMIREVVGRYLFNSPTTWVDEVAGYVVAGATFLGAAYALRRNELVSVTLVIDRLGERLRHWAVTVGYLVSAVVLVVVVYYVAQFVVESHAEGIRSNSTLRTSLWIPRAVMLLGLVILLLETLRQVVQKLSVLLATTQGGRI